MARRGRIVVRMLFVLAFGASGCASCFETASVPLALPEVGAPRDVGGEPDVGTPDLVGDAAEQLEMGVDVGVDVLADVAGDAADVSPDAADVGPDADVCVAETDQELCEAAEPDTCELTTTDTCGDSRTVECVTCDPGQTCYRGTCYVDCPEGFEPGQEACYDVDECADGTHMCDANATCTNEEGGYDCSCNMGWVGDGFTCTAACPDGTCDVAGGETYETCPDDCAAAVDVAVGEKHSCALLVDGSARCWGDNALGQLGDGTTVASSPTPVKVTLPGRAASIAGGEFHTCAILQDGTAVCWGDNDQGELGSGSFSTSSNVPVAVFGIDDLDGISGGNDFTCAWRAHPAKDGKAWCWGANDDAKLGTTMTGADVAVPQPLQTVDLVREMDLGANHACALDDAYDVQCWGANGSGQLGGGSTSMLSTTAVTPSLGGQASAIGVGDDHSCAVMSVDGSVKCWGLNEWGALGDGNMTTFSADPVDVVGITGAVDARGGRFYTCVLLDTGGLSCWGEGDDGQLGDGAMADSATPVDVLGVSDVVSYSLGNDTVCAVMGPDGDVSCWGDGRAGQIGDGFMVDRAVSTQVVAW